MKIKNSVIVLLLMGILSTAIVLSGCSNKPDLKRWSRTTAKYLIAKEYPQNKVKIINCQSQKLFGSNVAYCNYYLINKVKGKFKCLSEFTQSVNNNWYFKRNIFVPYLVSK